MVTKNAINSDIPIEISKGGTNAITMSTSTGIESIPLNNDAFAELVFQQEDYKSKKTRMLETEE